MTFTVDDIRASLSRTVDMMSPAHGSRMEAIAAIARKCRMKPIALKRFINGVSKENWLRTAINIRAAYKQSLIEKIAEMQAELKAIEDDDARNDIWDIDLKIAELEAKIKERTEGLINASSNG